MLAKNPTVLLTTRSSHCVRLGEPVVRKALNRNRFQSSENLSTKGNHRPAMTHHRTHKNTHLTHTTEATRPHYQTFDTPRIKSMCSWAQYCESSVQSIWHLTQWLHFQRSNASRFLEHTFPKCACF